MHRAITEKGNRLFNKVSREQVGMFVGEVHGLRAMYDTSTIRIPNVYHYASLKSTDGSYIAMEHIEMNDMYDMGELGRNLARMHLAEPGIEKAQNGQFGFPVNNTIGATTQPNTWMDDWLDFFREKRLRHQAKLTHDSNLGDKTNKLCTRLDELFEDVKGDLKPSLIHADFWSGNVAGCSEGPVVFDSACYYGHREAEFGMMWWESVP